MIEIAKRLPRLALTLLALCQGASVAADPPVANLGACTAECKAGMALMVVGLINELGRVDFDEVAPRGERLESIRTLARSLPALGVERLVAVGHTGDFCTHARKGKQELAPDTLNAKRCDPVTPEYSLALGERLARSLATIITEATGGKVAVKTLSYGQEMLRVSYPEVGSATAGQWNQAARQNNRVEIRLE